MNLTKEEITAIADRLDSIIGDHFHDAIYISLHSGRSDEDLEGEVSDEDIRKIKNELKLYL
jgi:hypothetical protein|tara:strand:+ start:1973 stop:2155 length:183 start_codon:yes stop_codon:yes gene_type:complete